MTMSVLAQIRAMARRPMTKQQDWTWELPEEWATNAKPHVRAAIGLLAQDGTPKSTAELNAAGNCTCGGAIVDDLNAWAVRKNLPMPLVKADGRYSFASEGLRQKFRQALTHLAIEAKVRETNVEVLGRWTEDRKDHRKTKQEPLAVEEVECGPENPYSGCKTCPIQERCRGASTEYNWLSVRGATAMVQQFRSDALPRADKAESPCTNGGPLSFQSLLPMPSELQTETDREAWLAANWGCWSPSTQSGKHSTYADYSEQAYQFHTQGGPAYVFILNISSHYPDLAFRLVWGEIESVSDSHPGERVHGVLVVKNGIPHVTPNVDILYAFPPAGCEGRWDKGVPDRSPETHCFRCSAPILKPQKPTPAQDHTCGHCGLRRVLTEGVDARPGYYDGEGDDMFLVVPYPFGCFPVRDELGEETELTNTNEEPKPTVVLECDPREAEAADVAASMDAYDGGCAIEEEEGDETVGSRGTPRTGSIVGTASPNMRIPA